MTYLKARAAAPGGSGGEDDGGVRAFSTCGHFEIRQTREGKRSTGSFEAQVYLSVTDKYTWAVPHGLCHVYSSVTD
jgi:hypothetical protein